MIISHLPALDLLVLQRVNKNWIKIINDPNQKSIQMKLFMKQDPYDEQWGKAFGGNGLRWNPFLEHFGVAVQPRPGSKEQKKHRITIKREHLRKKPGSSWKSSLPFIKRPEASWRKMYVSYPTRVQVRAFLILPFIQPRSLINDLDFTSKEEATRMGFLMYVDSQYTKKNHSFGEDSLGIVAAC